MLKAQKNIMNKNLLFLFIFAHTVVFSQKSNFGDWLIYIGNKKINKNWNWHNEVQYRNYNAIGDLEQLLVRTGIGYNLSENNNNVLLGYGFIQSEDYVSTNTTKLAVQEHRIYQQFITKQEFGRLNFQHRYRFEQRFIERKFRMRFRYFLGLTVALSKKKLTDNTLYFSAYNELFVQAINQSVFDRNRLYGGIGYKFNKTIKVEIGYMNQFLVNNQRDQLNIFAYVNF